MGCSPGLVTNLRQQREVEVGPSVPFRALHLASQAVVYLDWSTVSYRLHFLRPYEGAENACH